MPPEPPRCAGALTVDDDAHLSLHPQPAERPRLPTFRDSGGGHRDAGAALRSTGP
ncbi:hypothetical protein [Micromonospora sp. KC723]|uniref:hypothetical protein n=1 Tax=Micromonospora sp. KC723 TaxID=2530381 RepID=UPI0014046671|nr:hypothetical protein [Micromonospora sp. KC723]